MSKKMYWWIKSVIALISLMIILWLYFSKPSFQTSGMKVHTCNALSWRFDGPSFSMAGGFDIQNSEQTASYGEYYGTWDLSEQEVRKYVLEACNLARDDRRTMITIYSVLFATVFLSIPKPSGRATEKKETTERTQPSGPTSESAWDGDDQSSQTTKVFPTGKVRPTNVAGAHTAKSEETPHHDEAHTPERGRGNDIATGKSTETGEKRRE